MHKAWSSIDEVPYCFSRSSVKIQGHTALKIVEFDPNWAFPDCNSSLNTHGSKKRRIWPMGVSGLLQFEFTNGYEMMHKAWSRIEEVTYCFSRSYVKLQCQTALKIVDFDPDWAFPDCNFKLFEFTNGYKMMHKAWSSIEEVPYWFSRSSVKFQGHTTKTNRRIWPKLGVSGL